MRSPANRLFACRAICGPGSAAAYSAIVDARSVNAAETHVRGLDLTGTYALA